MRVYLTIQRNRLPSVDLVWIIPDVVYRTSSYTISNLLKSVDEVIPLETDTWGLEDYAVHIGDFECLHFSKVKETLQESDHVL